MCGGAHQTILNGAVENAILTDFWVLKKCTQNVFSNTFWWGWMNQRCFFFEHLLDHFDISLSFYVQHPLLQHPKAIFLNHSNVCSPRLPEWIICRENNKLFSHFQQMVGISKTFPRHFQDISKTFPTFFSNNLHHAAASCTIFWVPD